MFVEATCPVPLAAEVARDALVTALAGSELSQVAADAYEEGLCVFRNVGPHGVSKRVLVRTLPAREIHGMTVIPIRWEATGRGGHLFPTLDANLTIVPVNDLTSVLSIVGCYDAPLGRVGEVLDRSLFAKVAQSTVNSFVQELVSRMRQGASVQT